MDMTIRAMKPDERNYSYTQEKSVQKNTGCIGHLRGDMGRSGEEFYTSWDDHEASLKTETFKSEFNSIVNALRKDERYGLLLSSEKHWQRVAVQCRTVRLTEVLHRSTVSCRYQGIQLYDSLQSDTGQLQLLYLCV